ncbi:MAG: hypothetical protein AB7V14_06845 [Kiritimatiellia bacterium]
MNVRVESKSFDRDEPIVRRPYEKPDVKRVDLALAETLSQGCKLEADNACVGPPITALEGGS